MEMSWNFKKIGKILEMSWKIVKNQSLRFMICRDKFILRINFCRVPCFFSEKCLRKLWKQLEMSGKSHGNVMEFGIQVCVATLNFRF